MDLFGRIKDVVKGAYHQLAGNDGGQNFRSYMDAQEKKRREEQKLAAERAKQQMMQRQQQQRQQQVTKPATPTSLKPFSNPLAQQQPQQQKPAAIKVPQVAQPPKPVQQIPQPQLGGVPDPFGIQKIKLKTPQQTEQQRLQAEDARLKQMGKDPRFAQAYQQMGKKVADVSDYYKSDAMNLRAELLKGDKGSSEHVARLVQSLKNREAELGRTTDDPKSKASLLNRIGTIKSGVKKNEDIKKIAERAGLSEEEVKLYTDKNNKGYKAPTLLEGAAGFVGDIVKGAVEIGRKPIATLSAAANRGEKDKQLADLNAKFQRGEISSARLKQEFDTLTGDIVGKSVKVTENGIERASNGDKFVKDIQDFTGAGVNATDLLPGVGGVKAGLKGAGKEAVKLSTKEAFKEAAKESLKRSAKESTVYGTAATANDVVQGREVNAQSLALNYGLPIALGVGGEMAVRGAQIGGKKGANTVKRAAKRATSEVVNRIGRPDLDASTGLRLAEEGVQSVAPRQQLDAATRGAEALARGDDTALQAAQRDMEQIRTDPIAEAPAASPEQPRGVIQVVNNRTKTKRYIRPESAEYESLVSRIDNGRATSGEDPGIAGIEQENGDIYHITNRTPEEMERAGFEAQAEDTIDLPEGLRERVDTLEQRALEDPTPEVQQALTEARREVAARQAAVQNRSVTATPNQDLIDEGFVSEEVGYKPVNTLEIGGDSIGDVDPTAVQQYKELIANGQPIDPIVISTDENGVSYVQDGKHRLQALQEMGIENAPVAEQIPLDQRRAPESEQQFDNPREDGIRLDPGIAFDTRQQNAVAFKTPLQTAREELERQAIGDMTGFTPQQKQILREEIDNVIYERNPELFNQEAMMDAQPRLGEDGMADIPRMHVDDLRSNFGDLIEDIPTRYRRTTGDRDIDELAQIAGYDDIGEFVDAVSGVLDARRGQREAAQQLAEMRRDPSIIGEAKDRYYEANPQANVSTPVEQATREFGLREQAPADGVRLVQDTPMIREDADWAATPEAQADRALLDALDNSNLTEAQGQDIINQFRVDRGMDPLADAPIQQQRTGEQFAKPEEGFQMSKGYPERDLNGVILSESASGNQRKRLIHNQDTGIADVLVETRNADGSYTRDIEREPAIQSAGDFRGLDAVEDNLELNNAAIQAMQDGTEMHFYAAKQTGDPNSLSADVVRFDPEKMIIDGGFVRDADTNSILGNHIKVDDTGIAINIGKKIVNMENVVGDPAKWKNVNKATYTMDRNLQMAAPDDATYRKTRSFVIEAKQAAEADMRGDLAGYRQEIGKWRQDILGTKPGNVPRDEYLTDVFHFSERKLAQDPDLAPGRALTQEEILEAKYGAESAGTIREFDEWARNQYDSLLDRTNETLRQFGHDEVPRRDNYMTHLQEDSFWDSIGIGEDLYRDLSSGIQGETNMSNRGQLSGAIAGKTEEFKPTKKYNPFHQVRRGEDSMTDPFKAMDAYGEAALFNIHMTEPAVRARSLEAVFRTAEEITNKDMLQQVNETLRKQLTEANKGARGDLVIGFQEYANALAGKSNAIDRVVQDKYGAKGRAALKIARAFQKIASNSSIVGSANTTLAQTLNLPNVIGTNGVLNTVKGFGRSISDFDIHGKPKEGTPAAESDFLKVRYTDAQSKINRSPLQSLNDKVSKAVFMQQVERAMAEHTWSTSYEKAIADGYKGNQAVKEADRLAERLIAGRGIGDQPEVYRSTIGRTFLQYTLEVNAALKNLRFDMPAAGVVKYAIAVYGMNQAMEAITGRAPLADALGATIDTAKDFTDGESYQSEENKDGETVGDKIAQTGQRFAEQAANLSPIASAGINTFLSEEARKALFGADSSFGRYDGTPAAAGVVSKLVQGFADLVSGNPGGAWDKALSAVPYGGQIRKTTQGLGAMSEGYATDTKGTPTTAIDNSNPLGWIQAALFGKNSIPEVRAYFEKNLSGLGTEQMKVFDELMKSAGDTNAIDYLKQIQGRREMNKGDSEFSGDGISSSKNKTPQEIEADKKIKIAEGDWEERDGVVYKKEDGKVATSYYTEIAKQGIANGDNSDRIKQALILSDGIKLNKGISANGRDQLAAAARAELEGKKKADYLKEPKNKYQHTLAQYENDLKNGDLTDVQQYEKVMDLGKLKVRSDFSKEANELYKLSNRELKDYTSKKKVDQKLIDETLRLDQALADEGYISKPKLGGSGGSSGGSGGGSKRKRGDVAPLPSFGSFKLVDAPNVPRASMQSVAADLNKAFADIKILQGTQIAPGQDSSDIKISTI